MTSISVALATYNGARFIEEQLDSLARQTALPSELVITDDGSSDQTLSILDAFKNRAPFEVKIFRNEKRLGYKANFVECASRCAGDLIAFCDQDDVWHSGKLEKQLNHFSDPAVFLSCHNVRLIDQDGRDLGSDYRQFPKSQSFSYWSTNPFSYSQGFTQVFRRQINCYSEIWDNSVDHHIVSEKMAHDEWYFFLALIFGSVRYDVDIMADYRQHDLNASGMKQKVKRTEKLREAAFSDRRSQYERLITAAQNRVQLLTLISEVTRNGEYADRVQEARAMYEDLHKSLRRRYSLYSAVSIPQRISLLRQSVLQGDYAISDHWKNSFFGLARDCAYTLMGNK